MCKICNTNEPSWVSKRNTKPNKIYDEINKIVLEYTGMLPCKKLRNNLYAYSYRKSKNLDELIINKMYISRTTQKERTNISLKTYSLFNQDKIKEQRDKYIENNKEKVIKQKQEHNKKYENKLIKQTVAKSILMVHNLNTNKVSFKVKIEKKLKSMFKSFDTLKEAIFERDLFLQTL